MRFNSAARRAMIHRLAPEAPKPVLYVFDNGDDFVIAASTDDASAAIQETCGPGMTKEELLGEDGEWTRLSPTRMLTISDWNNDGKDEIRICASWAREGRGFLASRNL